MIKTISYDQLQILKDILILNNLETFDADLTYGNGSFYKGLPKPQFRFDIDESLSDIEVADSRDLPLDDSSIFSCVFDPPFLTYIKAARDHNSIMGKRFGGYWKYSELEEHYISTIKEAYRVLSKKGIFVFKCQDIIHNHKMHCTHVNVINWSKGLFRLKDLYVLLAKSRMNVPETKGHKPKKQKHARIFHSYFLVLEKL